MASILTKRAALFQPHKKEINGADSITLEKAITAPVNKLVVEGECVQMGTPTPTAPKEIVCNNGILRYCVNLINVIEENISVGYYIADTGTIYSHNANFYYIPFVPVEPNTVYTLTADSELYFISISEYDENQTFIKRTGDYAKEMTITTGANTHFLRFGSNVANSKLTLATVLAITWTLNRGDHYVQPGTVYTDTSPSINLAYPRIDSDQGWFITSGTIANQTSANRTVIIPCKPNTTYTWWHCEGLGGSRAFTLDSDNITLRQSASWAVQNPVYKEANELTTYTTGADARLLCICYGRRDSVSTRTFEEQANDFMVVEGEITTALPYVSGHPDAVITIKQRNNNTAENETISSYNAASLLAVGDYKDTQDIVSGKITRNIGIKVLDGTENWTQLTNTGSRFLFYIDEKGNSAPNAEPVCTIATGRSNNWSDDSDLIIVRTNRNFGIMNPSNMTNASTVEEWTAYLAAQYAAGTPVIVLYPLATPTTEQAAAQPIKTKYKFDTIIDTNGAISAKYWQPPF